MTSASARLSAALGAAALVTMSPARADSPAGGRAVIRGSGSNVSIVYEAPRAAPTEVRASLAADPVAEALRLQTSGEGDDAVVAFLRMHRASLPEVLDSDIVREFRRAGAGPDVIAVLASFTAVDIGETAEGGPPQVLEPSGAGTGAYPDLVGMGYPFYSGYGGYFAGGGGFDFGKGHFGKKHFGRHGDRRRGHFGGPSSPARRFSSAPPRTTRAGRR